MPQHGQITPPPIDASELNAICQTLANDYSRDEVLSNEVKTQLGLDSDATPNDAWMRVIPVGAVFWYAKNDVPNGFLKCDGSQVSRTLYADLFGVIGTVFGTGDNSTTFTLPNLMAAFIRGAGKQDVYTTVFGAKQGATYIAIDSKSFYPPLKNPFIGNQDATGGYGTISATYQTQSTLSPLNISAMYVRPYNVSLTPIIKY